MAPPGDPVPGPARRFEALVVDWDPARAALRSGALELRHDLEELIARAMQVALVTETPGDLGLDLAVPVAAAGRVLVVRADGSEMHELTPTGARRVPCRDPGEVCWLGEVDIGFTGKTDALRAALGELWCQGIAPPGVCVVGVGVVAAGHEAAALTGDVVPHGQLARVLREQLACRDGVPAGVELEGWSIVVDGIDPRTERADAAILALANGHIGTNGSPLLDDPAAHHEVVAAGVYDNDGPLTDLLAGPQWARLGRPRGDDRNRRVLDMHAGTLHESGHGATNLEALRLVALADAGVAALRARVDPPFEGSPLTPPARESTSGNVGGVPWMATHGSGGSITAAAVQRYRGETLERIAAYVCSTGPPDPETAVARARAAADNGFDAVLASHRRAWAERWARADVRIDGDDALQRAVRLALYHLIGTVADRGEAAVGARGLTGHAYRGHVFWDADLFVLPFFAATHPPAARAMLEYRIRRLAPARRAARAEGRRGARFPWESAATGEDVTPRAGRDLSGRVVPIRTGDDEVHIVGDVAWAACCYTDWTGDERFAAGPGLVLLVETARYWASRIRTDASGRGHLYGVIGPDEYHEPVDDNAYTNVLARWNLRRAAAAVARYDASAADETERASWLALADALVDGYDPATGIYEQFAGFHDLEPLLIADVAPRRPITADLLLGRDRVRAAQVVKQADVLMLHHLIPGEVAPGSLAPNLDFYEPRTAHGSSLSPAIHAAVMARAGRLGPALDALRLAANIDLDDLASSGAGGVHLAAMGGVWQALAFGFLGLRPGTDALHVDPQIPREWRALEVRLLFRGVELVVRAAAAMLAIHASKAVSLVVRGERVRLGAGDTVLDLDRRGAE